MCFHLNNDGKKTYHVKGAAMIRTPVSGRSVICSFSKIIYKKLFK
jgi:hypothetical protein